MAASGGYWNDKGIFVSIGTINIQRKDARKNIDLTLAASFDDVTKNIESFDNERLTSLNTRINLLLTNSNNVNQQLQRESPTGTGNIVTAFGADPSNKTRLKYEVVELESLTTSNTATGAINPDFPEELQPRDRSRTASRLQVEAIAKNLNNDALLTEFRSLDRGAPIVGNNDNVVESGNGRAMALNLAQTEFPDQYNSYKEDLKNRASEFGIDPSRVEKFKNPVLVRRRVDDVDRVQFAQEANSSAILGTSETEKSEVDANKITTADITRLEIGDNTDDSLRQTRNRGFVRAFVSNVPVNERATIIDRKGMITKGGINRIKAALLTKVYRDSALTDRVFEDTDNDLKNITNGLMGSLAKVAQAEELARSGQRNSDLSIANDITTSVTALIKAKKSGISVNEFLQQGNLFDDGLNETQKKIVRAIDARRRSGKKIKELLESWGNIVENEPPPQQGNIFGDSSRSKDDLVDIWLSDSKPKQRGFF